MKKQQLKKKAQKANARAIKAKTAKHDKIEQIGAKQKADNRKMQEKFEKETKKMVERHEVDKKKIQSGISQRDEENETTK